MKGTPDHVEYNESIGGEVRYYQSGAAWRYIHAQGEGRGFSTLEAAQAEVEQMSQMAADDSDTTADLSDLKD